MMRIVKKLIATLLLVALVTAEDYGEVNLPFGPVNVVVVTDVHSWIAGHERHEPEHNANYGHVVSFYEHIQNYTTNTLQSDVFFVMNGDFMDGTGLTTFPPRYLVPLLQEMPWDALNIGNHELYRNSTVEYITQENGFIDFWDGSYLTSNVVHANDGSPLGSRYKIMEGSNTGVKILTFGFLYNLYRNCAITQVERVQQVVQADWFVDVLSQEGDFDAILVLAHMDVQDNLVYVILNAIRSIVGTSMPVQFITGHTHYRGYAALDNVSTSFEAGRYLDTVGFVSFPTLGDVQASQPQDGSEFNATDLFQHVFVDANVDNFATVLAMDNYMTSTGTALSERITETQISMGLTETLGCAPQTYYLEKGLDDRQSLWGMYMDRIISEYYFQYDSGFVYIQNIGAFRTDLYEGEITMDDMVSVSPYNDTVYMVAERIQGSTLMQALGGEPNYVPESSTAAFLPQLPRYVVSNGRFIANNPDLYYDIFAVDFDVATVSKWISNATGTDVEPIMQLNSHTKQPVTTSGLWMGFIEEMWPCREDSTSPWPFLDGSTTRIVIAVVMALVAIFGVVQVTRVCRKRCTFRTRRDYEEAIVQDEGVSYSSVI